MNAVGIDVSKGRSTVSIIRQFGEVVRAPFDVSHTAEDLKELVVLIKSLPGETKVLMESTGNYHEPVARTLSAEGIFVCVVNAWVIKQYNVNHMRRAKTDKKDSMKLAAFCIDCWLELVEYRPEEDIRRDLKLLNRQYQLNIKTQTQVRLNLISQLELTFPGIRGQFTSPLRDTDGHEKWVDFVSAFPHRDRVAKLSLSVFKTKYRSFCKKKGYQYTEPKAVQIHTFSRSVVCSLNLDDTVGFVIGNLTSQLIMLMENSFEIRRRMTELAVQLPEYETVIGLFGVGKTTAPQLMAEIGDPRRFHSAKAITAYAGLDTEPDDSGQVVNKGERHITKRGPAFLRKTLFMVMTTYLEMKPQEEPVYQFLDKKRSEGKMYYVYMTAAANKFLRIYYARVRDALKEQ